MKKTIKLALSAAITILLMGCGAQTENVGKLTDALDNSAWDNSVWISAVDAEVIEVMQDRAADGASWFVSTVKNENKVVSAKWMTTGLGVYQLFVNGKSVGNEILKPGFTHYAKTKISFTYDISDAIAKGKDAENTFSAQVTPGWWADKIISTGEFKGMTGKKCAFRAVLELTFSDGSKKLYGTDLENWKAGVCGPVKHAAIFDGEEYDARELPGYACQDKLQTPEENTEFQGKIFPTDGAEIYLRKDLTLVPQKTYVWKDIEGAGDEEYGKVVIDREYALGEEIVLQPGENLVVDFGQNSSAVPYFEFKAEEGTTLTCLPSELLNDGNGAKSRGMDGPEGSCHRRNLRIPETGIIVKYTFKGGEEYEKYHPTCTFFGYRLVAVTADKEVKIKKIVSIPVTSISKEMEIGTLTTGNDLINRLISNTVWGQRSNYLSVSTDCPQRNERLGWTADTQVFTETGTFFANTMKFFHKWMRDMIDSQHKEGGFPGVAPYAQYGNESSRVGWSDAGVIVPWNIWKQFGDTEIVDQCWDALDFYMDHLAATKYDHNALITENGNYQWADWLSYEDLESCGGRGWKDGKIMPETIIYWSYLSANYWIMDADMMADMAGATGRNTDKYKKMAAEAREYTKSTFLEENGEFKCPVLNTMQTPALFALKNGLVEGEAKENMIARLRQNFADHENCLQTGFLGTSILMETLTANGMVDIAYELLFQRKNPSWLYSVDNGATTIWERWNSYTLENGMGPSGMNSFNHYAYGAVCSWIWKTACGIAADPANPGFKHIIMSPVPDKRLGSIKGVYKSAAGLITSEWKYEDDKWIWDFTIPEGATATVTLPNETESAEYVAGTYHIEK